MDFFPQNSYIYKYCVGLYFFGIRLFGIWRNGPEPNLMVAGSSPSNGCYVFIQCLRV